MMHTFSKSLWIGLMVSFRGEIPSTANNIQLSDIMISYPTGTCGGVFQHDMGKISKNGQLTRTRSLNNPPSLLLAAVNKMRTNALIKDPLYPSFIDKVMRKKCTDVMKLQVTRMPI
jgi:hypothetical protein